MAYDPTLPTINTGGNQGKKRERVVKTVEYDFGTFVLEEIPMDLVWPAGDPCPNDKETLVCFLSRSTDVDDARRRLDKSN